MEQMHQSEKDNDDNKEFVQRENFGKNLATNIEWEPYQVEEIRMFYLPRPDRSPDERTQ